MLVIKKYLNLPGAFFYYKVFGCQLRQRIVFLMKKLHHLDHHRHHILRLFLIKDVLLQNGI
jgi:hypothetical protein